MLFSRICPASFAIDGFSQFLCGSPWPHKALATIYSK